ncbi:hypothetical protein ABR737_25065 [Streptomyces sp. Edi2]|uniref:hypothetical protein n=1 Tax=Streptomyces sp. Edi2 TaxID=3162528 RepID=UPI00330604FE
MTAACLHCHRETVAPVAVGYIERVSGPGVTLYACPDHAPLFIVGPLPTEVAPPRRD